METLRNSDMSHIAAAHVTFLMLIIMLPILVNLRSSILSELAVSPFISISIAQGHVLKVTWTPNLSEKC